MVYLTPMMYKSSYSGSRQFYTLQISNLKRQRSNVPCMDEFGPETDQLSKTPVMSSKKCGKQKKYTKAISRWKNMLYITSITSHFKMYAFSF